MQINSIIAKELVRLEKILTKSGLYRTFTYVEEVYKDETYNAITGDYDSTSTSVTHEFNGVPLQNNDSVLEQSAYFTMMTIIVIASNIEFDMRSGLEFTLDGIVWNVSTFKLNPENSTYEISLGRK